METPFQLSRHEKTHLILRYLRSCLGYFAIALLCACLSMVFNAMTPQIIKITVDSILGTEPAELPFGRIPYRRSGSPPPPFCS